MFDITTFMEQLIFLGKLTTVNGIANLRRCSIGKAGTLQKQTEEADVEL